MSKYNSENNSYTFSFQNILLIIIGVIFVVEVAIMVLLDFFPVENNFIEMIVDGVLLSVFSAPFLYHFLPFNLKGLCHE